MSDLTLRVCVFTLFMTLCLSASNCGGNCPGGNCPTCDCGTSANYPDLASLCSGSTWEQNCCKCIILRRSFGNTNFMATNSTSAVTNSGLMSFNNN